MNELVKGKPVRQIAIVITVILVLVIAKPASALGPITIYGGAGFSKLSSPDDYKQNYESGTHFSIGLGVKMAPALQIVPKFEYHSFAPEDMGDFAKMKISMYGADARLSVSLPGFPFAPVLLAGIGLAAVEKDASLAGGRAGLLSKTTDFYYNIGGGIEFNRFIFMVRHVSVSADGETISYTPFTIGLKL